MTGLIRKIKAAIKAFNDPNIGVRYQLDYIESPMDRDGKNISVIWHDGIKPGDPIMINNHVYTVVDTLVKVEPANNYA